MREQPPIPEGAPGREDPTKDENPRIQAPSYHVELSEETQTGNTRANLRPDAQEADVVGEIRSKGAEAVLSESEWDAFEGEDTKETEVPEEFRDSESWFRPDRDTIVANGEVLNPEALPESYSSLPDMEMPRMQLVPEKPKEEEEEVEVVDLKIGDHLPKSGGVDAASARIKQDAIKTQGDRLALARLRKHRGDNMAAMKELEAEKGSNGSMHDKVIDRAIEDLKTRSGS